MGCGARGRCVGGITLILTSILWAFSRRLFYCSILNFFDIKVCLCSHWREDGIRHSLLPQWHMAATVWAPELGIEKPWAHYITPQSCCRSAWPQETGGRAAALWDPRWQDRKGVSGPEGRGDANRCCPVLWPPPNPPLLEYGRKGICQGFDCDLPRWILRSGCLAAPDFTLKQVVKFQPTDVFI